MKKRKCIWRLAWIGVGFFALGLLAVTKVDKIFGGCGSTDTIQIFVNDTMKASLFRFRIDQGRYPTTEEGLAALTKMQVHMVSTWKGPYLEQLPMDPWGNEYQYRFPGIRNAKGYDLWSMGSDGVNSGDDIGNWEISD